jgi:hypothetical protein
MRVILPSLALLAGSATAGEDATPPSALEAGWDDKPVCEQLHRATHARTLRCTFPPGGGHVRHFHPPHFGYALSGGTMELTDAGGVRIAKIATGSHYRSDGTPWHSVRNVVDKTVTYLIVEELPHPAS